MRDGSSNNHHGKRTVDRILILMVGKKKVNNNKKNIHIYIYIYIERERERERDNKSTMPENAEKYFYGPIGIRTHDLGNTA